MKKVYRFLLLALITLLCFSSVSCVSSQSNGKDTDTQSESREAMGGSVDASEDTDVTEHIPEDTSLKIMSQNLYYKNSDENGSVYQRSKRFSLLVDEHSPDIIGAQEATAQWVKLIKDIADYAFVGDSRNGKSAADGEWCPILYKKVRFELIDSGTFWLSDTPDDVSAVDGSEINRICTWAYLRDKYTDEEILMANTHLENGTDEVRSEQVKYLTMHLNKILTGKPMTSAVYLTGDFNCDAQSQPYADVLADGFTDSRSVAAKDSSVKKGTYQRFDREDDGREIDFCFFKGEEKVLEYRIISSLYQGKGDAEADFVSDHYALMAIFKN